MQKNRHLPISQIDQTLGSRAHVAASPLKESLSNIHPVKTADSSECRGSTNGERLTVTKPKRRGFMVKNSRRARRRVGRWSFGCYLLLIPMFAWADSVTDALNNLFGYLTGDVGKAVAAIAIVGVGFGCFGLGRIPKSYVIAVVIGVGVIFGAQALLTMLTGG